MILGRQKGSALEGKREGKRGRKAKGVGPYGRQKGSALEFLHCCFNRAKLSRLKKTITARQAIGMLRLWLKGVRSEFIRIRVRVDLE